MVSARPPQSGQPIRVVAVKAVLHLSLKFQAFGFALFFVEIGLHHVAHDPGSPVAVFAILKQRDYNNFRRFFGRIGDKPGVIFHRPAGGGAFQIFVGSELRGSGFAANSDARDGRRASGAMFFVHNRIHTGNHFFNVLRS